MAEYKKAGWNACGGNEKRKEGVGNLECQSLQKKEHGPVGHWEWSADLNSRGIGRAGAKAGFIHWVVLDLMERTFSQHEQEKDIGDATQASSRTPIKSQGLRLTGVSSGR
jgi:hypothetical protein